MTTLVTSRRSLTALLLASLALAAGCERGAEPAACIPEPAAATPAAAVPLPTSPPAAAPEAPSASAPTASAPARADAPRATPRATAPRASATDLRIRRLVIAEGVEGREPKAPRRTFVRGELDRVYAFVEVENPERLPGGVVVSFEPADGPAIGNVSLAVGAAPRWRTWAFSRGVDRAGEWAAVVRDGDGRVLAREPFTVTL